MRVFGMFFNGAAVLRMHPKSICTCNSSYSFLDVKVSLENNKFIASVLRKETFSGQGTSFFSFCFHNFKLNSIKTLVHIGPIILVVIIIILH